MNEIRHQITIRGPQHDVYRALSTIEGLSNWWTRTTSGDCTQGGQIDFWFGDHVSAMRVDRLEADRIVVWQCTRSAPDWVGTQLRFELTEMEGRTVVAFSHRGWRDVNDFFAHCTTKWAVFLLSLKQYVESGTGAPFPNDTAI